MSVEHMIETNLSPRCQNSIFWDINHVGGYVIPTQEPVASHADERHVMTEDDRLELIEFDSNALEHRFMETGICSNM